MDILGLGTLLSGAGSFLGGLFGLGSNIHQTNEANKWNQKQLDAQIQENQKNRDFNASQAEISRNFAREMFDESNRYNSMSNQVSQMRAAGLNPALAYSSNNFVGANAPSGASASSSGSVSPTQYATTDVAGPALAISRQLAEIDNIQAQTRKLNAEGSILESDAKFRDALNSGRLQMQHLSLVVQGNVPKLQDSQISEMRAHTAQMEEEAKNLVLLRQQISVGIEGQKLDNILKQIDSNYKSKEYEAVIAQIAAQTQKSKAEVYQLLTLTPAQLRQIDSQTALNGYLSQTQQKLAELYGVNIDNGFLQGDMIELQIEAKALENKVYYNSNPQAINGAPVWGFLNECGNVLRSLFGGILSVGVKP